MQAELHNRARLLVERSLVEGISPEEQRWLARHIAECGECSDYAELNRRTLRALNSFAFQFNTASALRVQNAVRSHAGRLASSVRADSRAILIAIALTIFGSIAIWEPARWLASRWNVPTFEWQLVFAILWLLPSLRVDVALVFREKLIGGGAANQGERV